MTSRHRRSWVPRYTYLYTPRVRLKGPVDNQDSHPCTSVPTQWTRNVYRRRKGPEVRPQTWVGGSGVPWHHKTPELHRFESSRSIPESVRVGSGDKSQGGRPQEALEGLGRTTGMYTKERFGPPCQNQESRKFRRKSYQTHKPKPKFVFGGSGPGPGTSRDAQRPQLKRDRTA